MNSSQINELFLSNKRLNELVFDLNTRLTNKVNTLENKVDILASRIENIYLQNTELINMFHMKNNEEFSNKLKIINDNMDKLNNLSTLVCAEINAIGNNLYDPTYNASNENVGNSDNVGNSGNSGNSENVGNENNLVESVNITNLIDI